ncbi:MAG: MFS transporter [Verrucomicrobiota bacterium]
MKPDARTTYFYERWRAVGAGVVETLAATFFLLIVIEYYQADAPVQAVVAASHAVGLLLSPLLTFMARSARIPVSHLCALQILIGAMALAVYLILPSLASFVTGGIVASVVVTGSVPLLTQIYQQNYDQQQRGALFSSANGIKVMAVALFSAGAGWALRDDLTQVPLYVTALVMAMLFSAYCLWRVPSQPLAPRAGHFPYQSLGLLARNRDFRWLILVWMFMGFGNLMMVPLRTIFLVDEQFGLEYSPLRVALLTGVIPAVTMFCFTRMWGMLFDRMNFFVLRFILNLLFVVSILFYFLVAQFWALVLGSFLLGLAFSGGAIAWSLWVTKVAPPDEVADYMSVHTCMTGVRALIAPLVSVPLIQVLPLYWIVAISAGCIAISLILLGPEVVSRKQRPKGFRLTGEFRE